MGMFRIKNAFVSDVQPPVSDGLWFKMINGKVALYLIEGGNPKPLQLVDDKNTTKPQDDTLAEAAAKVKTDLVGTALDAGTADTINGAKAYAAGKASDIIGDAEDTAEDMTLYGLKAYIDAQIAG